MSYHEFDKFLTAKTADYIRKFHLPYGTYVEINDLPTHLIDEYATEREYEEFLNEVLVEGRVMFEVDIDRWDYHYKSPVLENPTRFDVAMIANGVINKARLSAYEFSIEPVTITIDEESFIHVYKMTFRKA